MRLDIPGRHPTRIQRQDHILNVPDTTRVLRNNPGLERGMPIPRHTHLHRAIARRNRLRGAPIPRIPRPPAGRVARLVTQMISHFRFERSFEAAFVSWFKSPSTPSSGVPDDFASLIRESIADGDNDSVSRCAAFCESDGGDVVCVTFRTFQGVNELVDHGPPGSYTDSVTPPWQRRCGPPWDPGEYPEMCTWTTGLPLLMRGC